MPTQLEVDAMKIKPILIKVPISENVLKTEINISVSLTRENHRLDKKTITNAFRKDLNKSILTGQNVWDYQSVFKSSANIKMLNMQKPESSAIKDLNDAIRSATMPNPGTSKVAQYCLGIASDETVKEDTGLKGGKIIYLINEKKLSEIRVNVSDINNKNEFIKENCYYGIKPFSNKLWSGNYKPNFIDGPGNFTNFSNIDLDKALKIVLSKVDELLYANKIPVGINGPDEPKSEKIKQQYQNLVTSKKWIVDRKLKGLIGYVESPDDSKKIKDTLINEFRELILDELGKFYAYDGIVSARLDEASLKILDGIDSGSKHRISIDLKSQDSYNIVSSKIGYSRIANGILNEWYILFDQKETQTGNIDFTLTPEITHLEYDVSLPENSDDSDIEHSVWIQLVKPIVFETENLSVKEWPKIKRVFPAKPIILEHFAKQTTSDNGVDLEEWNISKAGKWQYELTIKNLYDIEVDTIHFDFQIKNAGGTESKLVASEKNFEGFISYWASKILEPSTFASDNFIKDLFIELRKEDPKAFVTFLEKSRSSFDVKGMPDNTGKMIWNKDEQSIKGLNPADITVTSNNEYSSISITIINFDVFESDVKKRVISILPFAKVYRNPQIRNVKFRYETESVSPINAATPHIRFF